MDLIQERRVVTADADVIKCDICGALATHSCTDALQNGGEWQESTPRHGCAWHPVQSMVYFEDRRVVSAAEYERQQ